MLAPAPPYPAPPAEQPRVAGLDGPGQHVADVGQEQHHQGQPEHGVDHAEHLATAGPRCDITVAWVETVRLTEHQTTAHTNLSWSGWSS